MSPDDFIDELWSYANEVPMVQHPWFDGIITHEFPLDRINDALDLVRSGTAGRVLLRVNAP